MADNTTTTITSEWGTVNLNDFIHGLILATLSAPLTIIYDSLQKGDLNFDWKNIGTVALLGFLSYLIKKFFTPSQIITTNNN